MARRAGAGRGIGVYVGGIMLAVVAGCAVVYLWHRNDTELLAAREAHAAIVERGPRVEVVAAAQGPATRDIVLLGDVKANATATLYGKVSGYLKSIPVDRGDKVTAGQTVAEIESAETDSQYVSAVADLENKRRVAARDREMLARGNVAVSAKELSETNLRMAEANVRQLETLKSYEILKAPFAGTVTARFADPGALIQNAATNQVSSLPVMTISDLARLRVGAYVEQRDVPFVTVGQDVDVTDASRLDRRVSAKISRTTGALDPRTRTLYIEIDLDNTGNFLVAGSFANVVLHVPIQSYPQVPTNALVMRGGESFVATVTPAGEVKFRGVRVVGTNGTAVDIAEGIAVGDRIAVNLPGDVTDGSRIQPITVAARGN
ncbi:MAG: efflux transporter, family, subunit [Rhodospirillales bacterium]|nr:efflux transporter, family, subunit [Rhodospirillales bacterium]